MSHAIAIPKLGLTMTDCTLVDWTKVDGERVEKGEVLYSVETDKITSDIEADASGFLRRFCEIDTMHEVGAVIGGLFDTSEEALAAQIAAAPPGTSSTIERKSTNVQSAADASAQIPPRHPARLRVSPLARRLASEAGIDPAELSGTGARGAVLRRDVDAEVARRLASSQTQSSAGGLRQASPKLGRSRCEGLFLEFAAPSRAT